MNLKPWKFAFVIGLIIFIITSIYFFYKTQEPLTIRLDIKSRVLIVISSKTPNPMLYKCIDNLHKIQINSDLGNFYKICVVDSNSDDYTNYNNIKKDFPNVDIDFANNKNYEYGAWKYAYSKYPNYDKYICIQDTLLITKQIPIDIVTSNSAYTFTDHDKGFLSHIEIKPVGMSFLNNSSLTNYEDLGDNFIIATHSSFIVNNERMKDLFDTLREPPTNKDGSCAYERVFGLYFQLKNIKREPLQNYFSKIHGGRL